MELQFVQLPFGLRELLVLRALMHMDGDVCVHPFRVPLMIFVVVWHQLLDASVPPMWHFCFGGWLIDCS